MKGNYKTNGTVISVKKCWWLKVNTKSVRTHALDGAVFPNIIKVQYNVNGIEYQKRKYVSWNKQCPQKGDNVTIYYDENKPTKCTVEVK